MGTYEAYTNERNRLAENCNLIESAWQEANRQSDLEKVISNTVADNDLDMVSNYLSQARMHLKSSTIEVGIFGEVNRGKSTLINALVGTEVSSMRITPEQAVPVWVESGKRKTIVWYDNDTWELVTDDAQAKIISSQRFVNEGEKNVIRLVQYVELAWLPDGLRLVDTPGLDDPSLIDSFTNRTMEELNRVSAAVFVFVSPPGPGGAEVSLLRELSAHAIDHVFLVCNFYLDVWKNVEDRQSVMKYIEDIVVNTAIDSSDSKPKNVRLYAVNAKNGLEAAISGDDAAYKESGVASLRNDIEEFLTNGALQMITSSVESSIQQAASHVDVTLMQREKLLSNPERVELAIRDLKDAKEKSESQLDEITRVIQETGRKLEKNVGDILSEPFKSAAQKTGLAKTAKEFDVLSDELKNAFASATSRASSEFERLTKVAVISANQQLMDSFGVDGSFSSAGSPRIDTRLALGNTSSGTVVSRMNIEDSIRDAAVIGTSTALIGGSISGGVGMALIALGPIGWLIGAGLFGVVGAGGGFLASWLRNRGKISDADKSKFAANLSEKEREANKMGRDNADLWVAEVMASLSKTRSQFLHEKEIELAHIRVILNDKG
ncbi:MAG: dynamin family protein [Gammaproteobacteria bacterium]